MTPVYDNLQHMGISPKALLPFTVSKQNKHWLLRIVKVRLRKIIPKMTKDYHWLDKLSYSQ